MGALLGEAEADAAAAGEVEVERALGISGLGAARAVHGQVPVIDLATDATTAGEAIWKAAMEPGFFIVKNHGIPEEAIDEAFGLSRDFFSQSREAKEAQSPFEKSMNAGYEFFSQVRPSTGVPDQKESLQITAREGCMDGRWPSIPSFQERVNEFMVKSHELGCRILSILEPKACPGLVKGDPSCCPHACGLKMDSVLCACCTTHQWKLQNSLRIIGGLVHIQTGAVSLSCSNDLETRAWSVHQTQKR